MSSSQGCKGGCANVNRCTACPCSTQPEVEVAPNVREASSPLPMPVPNSRASSQSFAGDARSLAVSSHTLRSDTSKYDVQFS